MSGRTATDDQIIKHQQERDLGHGVDRPRDSDRVRAGSAGGDYPRERAESIEERRRRVARGKAGLETTRRGKPRA